MSTSVPWSEGAKCGIFHVIPKGFPLGLSERVGKLKTFPRQNTHQKHAESSHPTPTAESPYLRVDLIWNSRNLWVNMQQLAANSINLDLYNSRYFEYVMLGEDKNPNRLLKPGGGGNGAAGAGGDGASSATAEGGGDAAGNGGGEGEGEDASDSGGEK